MIGAVRQWANTQLEDSTFEFDANFEAVVLFSLFGLAVSMLFL